MGVGSEVWSAVTKGRKGNGAELKASYFRQAGSQSRGREVRENLAPPVQEDIFTAAEPAEVAA